MTSKVFIDRGLNRGEVRLLLHAHMPDRERAFLRGLYETFFRPNELLQCDVEDYNRQTGEIIARHCKRKYNPRTKKHIEPTIKHMVLSPTTQKLFQKIISNRKKGPIFINQNNERISLTYFQVFIHDLAVSLGIQQVTHITPSGKKYHLITLKSLRECGERHCDLSGADPQVTARGASHSAIVKERYYKRSSWEEIQDQVRKYHPAFQEVGGI